MSTETQTTKQLVEKSIKINGMGKPGKKTIFTIENDFEKTLPTYSSLKEISGRKLTIEYNYLEDETEKSDRLQMIIPFDLNEDEVKTFILSEINNKFTL